jgi:hypothetical protein
MAYLYLKVDASNLSINDMNQVVGNNQQFLVSSTSGASTTLTVNTSSAHGFSNGDSVIVTGLLTSAGVPVANTQGLVEGVFVISNVASTSFQITISSALTTAQAASGAVGKFTAPSSNGLASVVNLISGIQAGAIDGVVQLSSSVTNRALPLPSSAGNVNFYNLK